nr:hypothetical protein [Tanacetum cinerariifolium]
MDAEKDKSKPESSKAGTNASKAWKISKENENELKRSANKYVVLSNEDNGSNGSNRDDEFADKRLAMERKDALNDEDIDEEDVYENQNGTIHDITANDVSGNIKNISKVCDKVFGSWRWISNVCHSPTSCRIVIGWNANVVDVVLVQNSSQEILCIIEDVHGKIKMFVRFIYASNSIPERRYLWKKLHWSKKIVNNNAWILMGDFNVTMSLDEKYIGASNMSIEIPLKVESICGEDGERFEGSKVADQFVDHFHNFLGKLTPVKPLRTLGDIAVKKLSKEVVDNMIIKVTDEEIKKDLFDIDSNKAASPDRYTSIKEGLNMVISLNQSAFIPGRHIQDNILITQELFKGYNGKQCAKRGRGLRQGDPISPYIFTLVMEVLNMIMIKEIRESGKFKYHYGCKELKLTHMCFIDDLLILCNDDKESIGVVNKVLNEFSEVSGLLPNLNKSTIFFRSVNEGLKRELLQILPFKLGILLMKYLGVPLVAKKLGMIQLIASILSSMHQYYASVYILPSAVVKDLDKLFKKFLWNSGDSVKGKARVAWNLICRPKDHGGLVKLNGKSFWEIEPNVSDNWGWKNMLDLKDKMKPFCWS